jgi:hypothetical protein
MIDQITFANLFNRATPELVASSLRQYHKDKALAQNKSDQAATEGMMQGRAQQAEAGQQIMQAQQSQEAKQVEMMNTTHEQELEKIAVKEAAKNEREALKRQSPQ